MEAREEPPRCWVDGHLVDPHEAALPPTDSAFASGRGCYTTARYEAGTVRFAAHHARRIVRDAERLGLGEVDPERVLEGLSACGREAFAEATGIVRIQASRAGDGRLHLVAVPRRVGPEPETWRAIRAPFRHEGPMPWSGVKVSNHLLFALAGDAARQRGVDEALLVDAEERVVEGSRSNLVVVDAAGRLATPDLARGGVAGVGLEVLQERGAGIDEGDLEYALLADARELVAVNAIRGPRPIVELDGRPVGEGAPGPAAKRLADLFAAP